MSELAADVVTLLFADAEGSGRGWAEHPVAAHALLERHEAIFRAAVAGTGGHVFAVAGDAFWAAFSDPADALAAALAAQRELRAQSWDAESPLRARMALHIGPVRREGDFYAGPTVARALALLSTGYRARVVLTEAASDALRDRLPSGTSLLYLGRHKLLDSGERESVFELLSPDIESARPARVVATILFTDIVESTDRAVAIGDDRWRDELSTHHVRLRQKLARFGGKEIRSTGDGLCAVFTSPTSGIECACAMTEALGPMGIEIRAGLHTGECEVADDTIHGLAVHIAARVAARAGAGEVVVSGTVKELVAGSGIRFEDRGLQTLKGLPGDWRVFSVEARRDSVSQS